MNNPRPDTKGIDLPSEGLKPTQSDLEAQQKAQRIAEYKQLLNLMPEEWQLNLKSNAGEYTPSKTSSHPIEYWSGYNEALDMCRKVIEDAMSSL